MFTAEQRFNIEIKHYEKGFVSYGLLPTLLLLEQYEAEENYLECFYIKTAIDNLNKRYDQDFPTRYGKNALKYVKAVYDEKKLDYDQYLLRVPTQVGELYNQIKDYRNKHLISFAGEIQLTAWEIDELKQLFK